jgi:hypothetical protein
VTTVQTIIDPEEVKRVAATLNRLGTGRPAGPPTSATLQRQRRETTAVLSAWGKKVGLPIERLDQLARSRRDERRRLLADRLADQTKDLRLARTNYAQAVDYQRSALELLASPFQSSFVILDKPFLIWQTPRTDDSFVDAHYESLNSSVKIHLDKHSGAGSTQFTFYFLWTNDSPSATVFDVLTSLTLNGFCEAIADTGFFSGHETWANLETSLRLIRWTGWGVDPATGASNDQTPFPTSQATMSEQVAALDIHGGGLFGDVGIQLESFQFRASPLRANLIPVPAGATMLFEVSLGLGYGFSDGGDIDDVIIDFATDAFDRRVICPLVALKLLTPTASS